MTRTEKLPAELIALPGVNPAFALSDGAWARQSRKPDPFAGEKRVADFPAVAVMFSVRGLPPQIFLLFRA